MHGGRPPLALILAFAAFLAVIASLVAASLLRPDVAEFLPTPPGNRPRNPLGPDTATVDARSETEWRFFSVTRGPLAPPDTAGWDLAFRRFHVVTWGPAADAGPAGPGETTLAAGGFAPNVPRERFAATVFARDTANPALAHWYRYNVLTHLLRPNGHVYLVETRAAGRIALEFLSYYCPGAKPGCVTFRWQAVPR